MWKRAAAFVAERRRSAGDGQLKLTHRDGVEWRRGDEADPQLPLNFGMERPVGR